MTPGNPVVGSTILRRPAIQSPNFVTQVSGWTINADGSAEFNNLTIRGTFNGTDFILNSSGLFFYSSTPALGNLSVSVVPGTSPVTDPEGNTAEPGLTAYTTLGSDRIALQLGQGSFGGTPAGAFFTHDQTSPANSDPMFGATEANSAGCSAVLFSGTSTNVASGAGIQATDSVGSGVPGGEVAAVGGQFTVQGNLVVQGNATLSSGATGTVPMAAPSRTNLGSTWNATTASQCNQNFVNIINALGTAGIF